MGFSALYLLLSLALVISISASPIIQVRQDVEPSQSESSPMTLVVISEISEMET